MRHLIMAVFLLFMTASSGICKEFKIVKIKATAYCLTKTKMTNGQFPHNRCIALSRKLAKDLGLYNKGLYDYKFGSIVVIDGLGEFVFKDLMPPKWKHYRVDIWKPSYKIAKSFGLQDRKLYVKLIKKRTNG